MDKFRVKITGHYDKPNIWYADKIDQVFEVKKGFDRYYVIGTSLFLFVHQDHCTELNDNGAVIFKPLVEKKIPTKRTKVPPKVFEAVLKEIKSGVLQREIGKKFNIHQGTVSNIKLRKGAYLEERYIECSNF